MEEIVSFIDKLVSEAVSKMTLNKVGERLYSFKNGYNLNAYYDRLPDFNDVYKETIKQHDIVAVHAKLGVFPYEILRSKAPNQSPDEWEYQMGLYESYTNSTWNRAKNKTKIIANKQNYSITGWDAEQKPYFYSDYPEYHSLESFFFDIVRDRKIDYPNQILLIKPDHIPGYYDEDEIFHADQSEMISPVAYIIPELDIVEFDENEYLLIITDKKVKYIGFDGKYKHDGIEFEFFDKNSYWKIKQVGVENKKPVFEYTLMYEHNWGYVPARRLGGKPIVTEDGDIYYHSWFIDAVPDLNDVIRLSSNLMMSTYKLAFPIIIAVVDRCNYTDNLGQACNNGKIWYGDKGKFGECPSCNGTGKQSSHSPTGVYEIAATRGIGQDNNLAMTPPIQFAAPDSDILEYTKNQIEEKKRSAFNFLFESEEAKSNTATGSALEKEEFHSFLLQFSNELFDLMEFAIQGIGFMRYGESFKMPSIRRPTYFSFRTNEDITVEIGDAIKNNLPQPYVKELINESTNTRFNTNAAAEYETELAMQIDRLWSKDSMTIRTMIGVTCTKTEAIIHDSFSTIYKEILDEIGLETFVDLSLDEKKQLFVDKANKILFTLQPAPQTAAADILASTTSNAMDSTAELRGSVGGLTGMIEIVKAVASGLYDLDAAVALVQDRFGLTEEDARAQLGTPNIPTLTSAETISKV
jgi:hypothetical protein